MATFAGQTTGRKYLVIFGASITLVILVGLGCAILVHAGMGPWIELFNGATWPASFDPSVQVGEDRPPRSLGFWFYVILACRTVLNLGAALSAVLAICWLVAGGLERMVMKQLETLSRVRTAALVSEMLAVLEEANVDVPPEVEKRMFATARQFDKTQLGDAIKKRAIEAGAPA